MKKEELIRRIFLSMDKKELNGFVVVRRGKIEKYGYGELEKEELYNKYSEIVGELRDQEKDKVEGLSDQEAINELYNLGKLVYSKKDFITGITVYGKADKDEVSRFEVNYTNSSEFVDLDDCYDEIEFADIFKKNVVKMCKFYGIKVNEDEDLSEELFKKLEKLGLLKEEGLSKEDISEPFDEEDIILPEEKTKKSKKKKETLKEHKIKNFVVNHKGLTTAISALGLTGVLVLVSTIGGCSKKNNNDEPTTTPEPTAVIEVQKPDFDAEEDIDFFAGDYVEEIAIDDDMNFFPVMPTVEPVYYGKSIYIDGEEDIFANYVEPDDDYLLMLETNGTRHYDTSLEVIDEIRNSEMEQIANNIQGKQELNETGHYVYYEHLFNGHDLKDKAFVKYFSMLGNEIVKNAYVTENQTSVQDYARQNGLEVLKLIGEDVPKRFVINNQEEYISFSELSRDAKELVLNIAWKNLFALNSYNSAYKTDEQLGLWEEDTIPEVLYNGVWYTKANVGDVIIDKANELSMIR